MFWVEGFFVLFGAFFVVVVGFFPVGISPVNDTVLSYVYKILSSITVQDILFFISYALIHCSLAP